MVVVEKFGFVIICTQLTYHVTRCWNISLICLCP